jgi:drug/metabolite transporter (DMT)-like permease
VAGISLVVGILCASHLDDLTRVVNFGALSGFLLLHAAVIHHYMIRGRSRAWLTHLAMPLAGLAVIGYVLYEMDSAAKIMGAVWIALGLVYFVVYTIVLKKPAAIDL